MKTIETWFLWLMIYSVIGWVYESTICSIGQRKLINRGFLNGPYCPIYGTGAVLVLLVLGRIQNPVLLFFAGAVLTCSLEYLTSWLMEKLFHARWWDYSKRKFNIGGRVCLIGAIVFCGARALTLTALSVAVCVFFEWAYRRIMKKDNTTGDLSAVVTGILVAFVCPVTLPFWTILIGDFFAIVVVKQLFGGIGANIVNPALAARAFLFSWPLFMNTWVRSGVHVPAFSNPTTASLDGLTAATPMASLHVGAMPEASVLDLFLGRTGGSLGEVSAMLLLLGGIYLLVRRVISARIPLAYLGTVAVLAFLFPRGGAARLDWMLVQVLSGGLMLGAWFMATDYTTSPVTHGGQIVYGVGCGVLTFLFRYFGSYVEGVSYAILIMNCCVGFFDRIGVPKRFGAVRQKKQKKGGAEA